ncbi:hypothetical protein K523DRAFT_189344, partial [Schizophyllum commune Tattone D]
ITIPNTGATGNFSGDRSRFITFHDIPPEPIKAADGRALYATGKGDMLVPFPMGE